MIYCEGCRATNKWPEGVIKHQMQCEVCGQQHLCHDVPSVGLSKTALAVTTPDDQPASSKRIPLCPVCQRRGIRSGKYDAYFCEHCNVWIEHGCDDPVCKFCVGRPEKPLEVACTS